MEQDLFSAILFATVVAGTPLIIVALGELVTERAGVLNLGAEGMMAIGAMQALKSRGREIPGDVQVIGFDDQPIAQVSEPALTTIHQPFREIGVHMVDQILDLIGGGGPTGTTLPLELVVRSSTR